MRIDTFSSVVDKRGFVNDFCRLPNRVRRGVYRTGLLPDDVWEFFIAMPVPLEKEFWVCYEGDRAIGRIGANRSVRYRDIGYFGFLELHLEYDYLQAGRMLVDTACDWLRSSGAGKAIGPMDFNTWFPYRFRLEDGDPRVFEWEPVNPPRYVTLLEDMGMEVASDYSSTAFGDLHGYIEKLKPAYDAAMGKGYHFRSFDQDFRVELPALYRITLDAFEDNYLFEPIPEDLFSQLYVAIINKEKKDLSHVILDPDGREVGFYFAFLDEHQHGRSQEVALVLKSVAIAQEARGLGLSNAANYVVARDAVQLGAQFAVAALVGAGVQSESFARKGKFLWRHDYRIWKKSLGSG